MEKANLDICRASPLVSRFFDEFDNHYKLYVACFSKKIDKLALWRYYANNGSGFAIGFNKKFHFEKEINSVQISNEKYSEQVKTEVRYDIEATQEIINEFLETSELFFHKATNQSDRKEIVNHLLASLTSLLLTFKDKSFEDEEEIRLFCCEGELMSDPITKKPPYYFDDIYREFIDIPFKENLPFVYQRYGNKPVVLPHKFSHSDISEIWVGPCCEFLEARTAIRKLLAENDFDLGIEIKRAPLPYQHS